uniref:WASH-7_N domain-containing protein n=1 Tax=Gongylonema pulchrum TaxID=637853 RepID=A0A183F1K8_9BILA
LQSSTQACLLNALEDYVTHEENSLARRNDKYSEPNFDFITFCREQVTIIQPLTMVLVGAGDFLNNPRALLPQICRFQMSLSRLYQSLDITEQVTAMFDELDAMLSLIALNHSSAEPAPKWFASSSTSVSDASYGCPLFIAMLKCEAPWEGITLLELRHIIFAHQILV